MDDRTAAAEAAARELGYQVGPCRGLDQEGAVKEMWAYTGPDRAHRHWLEPPRTSGPYPSKAAALKALLSDLEADRPR